MTLIAVAGPTKDGAARESPGDFSGALSFIENLNRLSNIDEVVDAVGCTLAPFGFEFFSFNTLPRTGQRFEDVNIAFHMPPEWRKIYVERQYVHVSPAFRFAQRTVRPFYWKSAPYDAEREPRAAEFVDAVTEFGLANAIVVPIPGPTGCEGIAWIGGLRWELTTRDIPILHLIVLYAFERLRALANRVPAARLNLTAREREVLTWVALGKSAWEIGEILGIAKRTADEHVRQAMQKLGASNRTQAVAIAFRDRLIEP